MSVAHLQSHQFLNLLFKRLGSFLKQLLTVVVITQEEIMQACLLGTIFGGGWVHICSLVGISGSRTVCGTESESTPVCVHGDEGKTGDWWV